MAELGEAIERLESTISTPEARYVSVLRSDFNVILAALKAGQEWADAIEVGGDGDTLCAAVARARKQFDALLAAYGKE